MGPAPTCRFPPPASPTIAALVTDSRVAALDVVRSVSVALGADGIPRTGGRRRAPQGQPPDRGRGRRAAHGSQRDRPRPADRAQEASTSGSATSLPVAPSGAPPVVLAVYGHRRRPGRPGRPGRGRPRHPDPAARPRRTGPAARDGGGPGRTGAGRAADRRPRLPAAGPSVRVPDQVRNLAELRPLPELLAVVLTAVAGAALVHTLLGLRPPAPARPGGAGGARRHAGAGPGRRWPWRPRRRCCRPCSSASHSASAWPGCCGGRRPPASGWPATSRCPSCRSWRSGPVVLCRGGAGVGGPGRGGRCRTPPAAVLAAERSEQRRRVVRLPDAAFAPFGQR